jgi:PIN domain nuclease of toxin-antitoxin system
MKLLLDTHALLWFLMDDPKLRALAKATIEDPANPHLVPIEARHTAEVATLPLHHRDPFDRLIAATALVEGLTLVSADVAFDPCVSTRLW